MDFKYMLSKYAEAIVKIGANVQKGQLVVIRSVTESREFVYELAEQAYKVGASDVQVIWNDDRLTRLRFENVTSETLEDVREWFKDQYKDAVERNAVFISLIGSDPNNLEGIEAEKIKISSIARSKSLKFFSQSLMNDRNSWVVVGAPTKKWANLMFPNLDDEKAVEKLWDTLFYVTRITGEDTIDGWYKHIENLQTRANKLNDYKFKYLKYKTEKGTDLTIELPKGHIWKAAGAKNSKGVEFTANMPTEEVYTLPHKNGVNGRVYSTKPLNYNSNVIDEFYIDFKDGAAVGFDAKKGKEILKTLLETDEGSRRLGEVALVPYDSPISNTNIMFYETLYDENASCHIALGEAYPTCLEGGTSMNEEELSKAGSNTSLVHVDFMIGDETLEIIGVLEDGTEIKVFDKGNWA
ncbi:aminopeptidase [Pseudostreptobacillus hongkongensis]|uniref:aminopeptidase n=1 Tax=Pseudostreptobacillus hongkongensis TaxID=1162717 RepID=UPI00082AC060|nr:aminopeptidase [Pseudostreptobacillus hongkongensis]